MKKLIIMAAAAAASALCVADGRTPGELWALLSAKSAFSERDAIRKSLSSDEWRASAEWVLSVAATNRTCAQGAFFMFGHLSPVLSEYDERLAAAGIQDLNVWTYGRSPKIHDAAWAAPTNARFVARRRLSIASCRAGDNVGAWFSWDPPKVANFVMEYHRIVGDNGNLNAVISHALQHSEARIKRVLRSKGKPITVGKDGVNPIQVEIDRLAAAFNAPRYAGVKEWMAEYYPEYQWIDSEWETNEEVERMKDKVYYGEKPFGAIAKMYLRANLGIDAYNAFVKRYNNEE